MGWDNKIWY